MPRYSLLLTSIALAGLSAGNASAQCAFNSAPAKAVKVSMVRNFAGCPSSEHPTANTETEGGADACTPVTPREVGGDGTLYSYGPKGKCTVSMSAKLVKACEDLESADGTNLGLQPGPCHVTFVKSKCSGILGTDGESPIGSGDDGWSLALLNRATLNDNSNGDMTVIDFPVTFAYSTPDNGSMEVDSSTAESLVPLFGVNNADLPTCTSIEVVDLTIKAPGGLPFASIGVATKPQ